jgi:hypothetical protein
VLCTLCALYDVCYGVDAVLCGDASLLGAGKRLLFLWVAVLCALTALSIASRHQGITR